MTNLDIAFDVCIHISNAIKHCALEPHNRRTRSYPNTNNNPFVVLDMFRFHHWSRFEHLTIRHYVDNVALYLTNALRIDAEHLTVIVNAKINAATRTIGE